MKTTYIPPESEPVPVYTELNFCGTGGEEQTQQYQRDEDEFIF